MCIFLWMKNVSGIVHGNVYIQLPLAVLYNNTLYICMSRGVLCVCVFSVILVPAFRFAHLTQSSHHLI